MPKFKHLILLFLLSFPNFSIQQYDNVDLDLEEEQDYGEDEDPNPNPNQPPEAGLLPPTVQPGGTAGGVPSVTLFKLPENYSVHKPPPLENGTIPTPVDFSLLIFNVFDIREIQEEIGLEVNYKLYWRDSRLLNWTKNIDEGQDFATMSTTLLHRIWHPDIFIDHTKRVTQPQLISPASSLRIYRNGSLRYTSRILLVLTCRMDFHFYPADTQECNVTIKSFAFSTKHMNLRWNNGIGALMAKSIDVHNFDVAIDTHPDYLQTTKSNNFSALVFGIQLRRKLSYHIIQTYVPSSLFTVVSWLSFLVPPESTPGRMAICVTTLLTVTAMFGSVKQNTPNVSYVKALDVWMFMCIVFIFLSLAEFTMVLKLRGMKDKPKKDPKPPEEEPKKDNKSQNNHVSLTMPNSVTITVNSKTNNNVIEPPKKPPSRYFMMAERIEKYSPKIVPFIFLSFTCLYWPYLLIGSDYYGLNVSREMYYSV